MGDMGDRIGIKWEMEDGRWDSGDGRDGSWRYDWTFDGGLARCTMICRYLCMYDTIIGTKHHQSVSQVW